MQIPAKNTFINPMEIYLRAAEKLPEEQQPDNPFDTGFLDSLSIDQLHQAKMELMRMETE